MILADKLLEERRRRLAAERLLEQKQAELFDANRKLSAHARALSDEIVQTRAEVAFVRDENARVKSDLTRANEKIIVSEQRLWQTIETIQDKFAFFDSNSRLVIANNAYLEMFDGIETVKSGVSYIEILQILTEEGIVNTGEFNAPEWRKMMMESWQEPNPPSQIIHLWNDQYIEIANRRGPNGDTVSLGIDITSTVENEKKLEKSSQESDKANRAKSTFLANMSHEIRTPMNGVVGMSDLLAETGLTDEQQLYVDTIKNSSEALLVIINDVLDFSKLEAEKLELYLEPFDLERNIHEIIMLLQPSARQKGITLALDYDLFLPIQFIGDPGRVRQVLTNLMGNALKFTEKGHVLVRVVGVPHSESGKVDITITIEDTGIGIPEDMIDHIFSEFNQLESTRNRKFGGTGLGLAISKQLVTLMGGDIWVSSEENIGSCFGFSISLKTKDDFEVSYPVPNERLRHILVVEDIKANRVILERQLGQLGLRVTCCTDGMEALRILESRDDIDLILSDHNMPRLDGLELAEMVYQKQLDIPIILMTSNPGKMNRKSTEKYFYAMLHKPVPRKELFAKLNSFIKQDQMSEEVTFLEPSEAEGRKMRVLAAEDNKTNRLVFSNMVKKLDIELMLVNDGEEAVKAYKSFHPDIIFMDISMPRMDGVEATHAIRNLEKGTERSVVIVAMTAHVVEGSSDNILNAGLDHYLTKPLRKWEIHQKLAENKPEKSLPLGSLDLSPPS